MDETFYRLMENKFGTAFPEEKEFNYFAVQNSGWSDPKLPSWFDSDARFSCNQDAENYIKGLKVKHPKTTTVYRIVEVTLKEEYTYFHPEDENK